MIRFLALAFCLFFVQVLAQVRPGCPIDITKLQEPAPLVLNPYTYEYLYPSTDNIPGDQTITLKPGETILVACPGGVLTTFPYSTVYATCNAKNQLVIDDKLISFNSLKCSKTVVSIRNTTSICDADSKVIEIGYEIGVGLKWIPLLDVCFNFVTRISFWTKFVLTKSIRFREYGSHDILEQDEIYNLEYSMRAAYLISKDTINNQVGLDIFSEKYVYLPFYRTRLTTQSEIFYSSQNEAVSVAINTFPEWPKHCYNWRGVDVAVQHYAIRNEVDLEVYTGTYGTVTAIHEVTFDEVTLHMYVDEPTNVKAVPIPGLMWRIAYLPKEKKATVFITVNVPLRTFYEEHIICEDVSDSVPWQPWLENTKSDYTCGYSYTCSYQDFKAAVPSIPDLDVTALLV